MDVNCSLYLLIPEIVVLHFCVLILNDVPGCELWRLRSFCHSTEELDVVEQLRFVKSNDAARPLLSNCRWPQYIPIPL